MSSASSVFELDLLELMTGADRVGPVVVDVASFEVGVIGAAAWIVLVAAIFGMHYELTRPTPEHRRGRSQ